MMAPTGLSEPRRDRQNRSLSTMRAVFVLALTAAVAFVTGVLFVNATHSPHDNSEFETFWQSWDTLESEYYFDLPKNKEMVYGAVQGLLATTGDRYTFLVPPAAAEFDRQMTA